MRANFHEEKKTNIWVFHIFYINGLIKIIEFSIRKYRSNTKKLLFETAKVASITAIIFERIRLKHYLLERLLLVSWLPFFLLLHIFSLVNLSKSIVSYFSEIFFYKCYMFSLITQIFLFILFYFILFIFYFFRITIIVKRHWAHGNGAIQILVLFIYFVLILSCSSSPHISCIWFSYNHYFNIKNRIIHPWLTSFHPFAGLPFWRLLCGWVLSALCSLSAGPWA